jgi:hypothetical protein
MSLSAFMMELENVLQVVGDSKSFPEYTVEFFHGSLIELTPRPKVRDILSRIDTINFMLISSIQKN